MVLIEKVLKKKISFEKDIDPEKIIFKCNVPSTSKGNLEYTVSIQMDTGKTRCTCRENTDDFNNYQMNCKHINSVIINFLSKFMDNNCENHQKEKFVSNIEDLTNKFGSKMRIVNYI